MNLHEDLYRHPAVQGGSDRSFGWVFAGFFLIVALLPVRHGQPVRLWSAALSVLIAILASLRPSLLHPLNVVWTHLGILLGRLVTPVVLAVLFFLVVTPIAWLMRAAGKRPLLLERDSQAVSYWIHRQPPGPAPDSMINQF